MKKTKIILVIAAVACVVIVFGIIKLNDLRVTPILMYHAIGDADGSLNVTLENFRKQMKYLDDKGFTVIPLSSLREEIKKGNRYIPKTVVITFDDGFANNYINAFPVLSRYKFPATIFIITGYMDKEKGYLSWDQVALMSKNGIDIGGHTRNNVYLPSVKDVSRLNEEIEGSRQDIMHHTGVAPESYCYPIGGYNSKVIELVKKAGYKDACTTNRGNSRINENVYELKRVKITNSDTNKPFHFEAKLSGFYNAFRSIKNPE